MPILAFFGTNQRVSVDDLAIVRAGSDLEAATAWAGQIPETDLDRRLRLTALPPVCLRRTRFCDGFDTKLSLFVHSGAFNT